MPGQSRRASGRSKRVVVAACLVCLVLAGCSSDHQRAATSSATSATVSEPYSVTFTPLRSISGRELAAAVQVVRRRLTSLGVHATVAAVGKAVVAQLDRRLSASDVATISRRGTLELREVLGGPLEAKITIPLGSAAIPAVPRCKDLVKHTDPIATTTAWFWDQGHTACYLLGPSLIAQSAVRSATAKYNALDNGWGVEVQYRAGAFAPVATNYVGTHVAIVIDGVVVSAPVISAGVTGDEIRIAGSLDTAQARSIATALSSGPLPSKLRSGFATSSVRPSQP
jgi:preprotein translocase subunit SecD